MKYTEMKTHRFRHITILVIASLALCVGCSDIQESQPTTEITLADSLKSSTLPDQESENSEIILYEGERRSTRILAGYIWKYTMKDSVIASALTVDFFDSSGAISAHLISDSGVILESRKLMVAIGSVELTNADSSILLTERLNWNNRTGLITSDEYVEIYDGADTLRGYGFETDRFMKRIKLHHQIEGSLSAESEPKNK
jgi:LPS export ABC transporter protein LptC